MKRTICSILAAGAALIGAAVPAHAESRHRTFPARAASAWERRDERAFMQLQRVRHRFYARWNGDWRERARFERWYAHRCEELRHW